MGKMTEKLNGYMEKVSAEQDNYSWMQKQKGVVGASSKSGKPGLMRVADPELIGNRLLSSLKHSLMYGSGGAIAGGGLGAALGSKGNKASASAISALLGLLSGGAVGNVVGSYKADKAHLKKKGITMSRLGLKNDFDDEATKKYLAPQRKK